MRARVVPCASSASQASALSALSSPVCQPNGEGYFIVLIYALARLENSQGVFLGDFFLTASPVGFKSADVCRDLLK